MLAHRPLAHRPFLFRRWSIAVAGIAMLGSIALVGCGGSESTVEAKGTLTWDDGKPISGATIRLVPKVSGRREPLATSDKSGQFVFNTVGKDGAPRGDYTVVVTQTGSDGGAGAAAMPAGPVSPEEMAKRSLKAKELQKKAPTSVIPPIYSDAQKSPLTLTISGPNPNIELKVKKS
jgi:hypothetical protein